MDYNDLTSRDQLKTWKVLATDDVEEDLSGFAQYLLFEKMSEQAANIIFCIGLRETQ